VSTATTSAGLATPSAPAKDRPARPTPRVTEILAIVAILSGYGRHIAQTLQQRAVARGFATIARFFGTTTLDTILAHLTRGLMRAMALQKMLERRAAQGRDLRIVEPRERSRGEPAAEDAAESGEAAKPAPPEEFTPEWAAAMEAAAIRAGERLARRTGRNEPLTLRTMPRMAAIEAEVNRRPVGRTIAAICRDFGISPSLCDGSFWNALWDAIRWHRGNAPAFVLEVKRREQRFNKEDWKHAGLELAEETRDGVRRVLGFFIGDPSVNLCDVDVGPPMGVAAVATGPP
jgi:hypothetical protein